MTADDLFATVMSDDGKRRIADRLPDHMREPFLKPRTKYGIPVCIIKAVCEVIAEELGNG